MNKRIVFSTIVIVLLAAGGGYALWQNAKSPSSPTAGETTTEPGEARGSLPEEKQEVVEDEEQIEDEEQNGETNTGTEADEEPAENPDVSVTLNNFGQQADGTVFANATVSGTQEGTCEFRFSRNNSTVVKTTDIERAPTGYYACGIRADGSEFTPKGEWTARVYIQDTDPQVVSDKKKAVID